MTAAPWLPDFPTMLALSVPANELPCDARQFRLYEAQGCRWLCDGSGAIQTAMCLARPEQLPLANHRAMLLAGLLPPVVNTVLDLGAGGGGFVRCFLRRQPPAKVDAVEADPLMIELARRHFALPADQQVHASTAEAFLVSAGNTYDLVFCDLFVERRAPAALEEPAFYALLADRLGPGAALAVNTLPASGDALLSVLRAARAVFGGIGVLQFESLGNIVLLLQRDPLPESDELVRRFDASCHAADAMLRTALAQMQRIPVAAVPFREA